MKRIIFLAGCSGSGKTYITEKLLDSNPNLFYKLPQFTTRPQRDIEDRDAYHFVSNKQFEGIESILISKTEVNGNRYGTAPAFADGKIALNVVNASGLLDGMDFALNNDVEYLIFNIENLDMSVEREGRCIVSERNDITEALKVIRQVNGVNQSHIINLTQDKNNWLDVKDVEIIIERWIK